MRNIIPLVDILYVFNTWTLMLETSNTINLQANNEICLLDDMQNIIGKAILNQFLPTKNPEIQPISIIEIKSPSDFKKIKFIALHD